jgi:predicted AlkP superfamily pyrophosphatase or phosphodiesterase
MITGVSPAKHGIFTNNTFDPFWKNFDGWYWYAEDIRVPTLWDAALGAGLVTANVHWPVSVGAKITYNLPQIWRSGHEDDRKMLSAGDSRADRRTRRDLVLTPTASRKHACDDERGRFACVCLSRSGRIS